MASVRDPFHSHLGRRGEFYLVVPFAADALRCRRNPLPVRRGDHLPCSSSGLQILEPAFGSGFEPIDHRRDLSLEQEPPVCWLDALFVRHRLASHIRYGAAAGGSVLDQLSHVSSTGGKAS